MKRDFGLRGASRRDFVKSVLTASAALGLGPTRALELLDQIGGSALAQAANVSRRSVNIVAGQGALSWFTLVWPAPRVITGFQASFAYDDPTKAIKSTSAALEGRSLYTRGVNGQALWSKYGDRKLVSAMLCGVNTGHETAPKNGNNSNTIPDGVGGAVGMFAASAAIQSTLNALVPVIGIKSANDSSDMPFGRAPGAPSPASVANASSMVGLFSSAASRLANRLQQKTNQDLFSEYYRALLGLTRTADRIAYARAQADSRVAVDLLAKNLGSQLQPAAGQVNMWCGNAAPANEKVDAMAQALIVTANAFKLNLTAQVNIPVFMDDPHGAFAGGNAGPAKIADQIVSILENFMAELDGTADSSNPGKKLSDGVVITVSGDLPKFCFDRNNWPDNSPQNANWIYVMSQGRVKPGWFGDITTTTKTNYDPATGVMDSGSVKTTDKVVLDGALASVLYAVTGGDDRRVRDFTTAVSYQGLINPLVTG